METNKFWQVISVAVEQRGFVTIEKILPAHIKKITGINFSSRAKSSEKFIGTVSLRFNGRHAVKQVIWLTAPPQKKVTPLPLNEDTSSGRLLQGYYVDFGQALIYPYTLKIYLHCEK